MGVVSIKSRINLVVGRTPTVGDIITYKDKDILNENLVSDYNECAGGLFKVPANTTDMVLSMGSVASGRLLYLNVGANLSVKLTNSIGISQSLVFKPKIASILNMDFTGLSVTNSSATDIYGEYAVVGD